jgi:uridine kinase
MASMPESVDVRGVVDRIAHIRNSQDGTVLIAIDGRGGAGKSTLARKIAAEVPDVTTISLDDFARPHVSGWDKERFTDEVLDPVAAGRSGRYQRWDWDTDSPAEWHDVPVGGVIVVEGVSSMHEELGHSWDLTIWVSAAAETRLNRGVARDGEQMRSQWTEIGMPEEDAYVAGQSPDERADLVVDGASRDSGHNGGT